MAYYKKILFLLLFVSASLYANAEGFIFTANNGAIAVSQNIDASELEIRINGTMLLQMDNIPNSGYLEVYSILGVKVTSINLKNIIGTGVYDLDLTKGIYIFKAGKTAKKVIVK